MGSVSSEDCAFSRQILIDLSASHVTSRLGEEEEEEEVIVRVNSDKNEKTNLNNTTKEKMRRDKG